MNLDVSTLFFVTIYIEAMLGLLLLFAWIQNAAVRALAWWGWAHLARAGSIVLYGLYGNVPDLVAIDLANAILLTTFAISWTGARVFNGRSPRPVWLLAGAAVWLMLCRIPSFAESLDGRILVSSGIIAAYSWLAAHELWRSRAEPLVSRWPAVVVLFGLGSLFLLRTPLAAMLPWSPSNQVFGSVWLTVLSLEALLCTIAVAFILLGMARERTELRHKNAVMLDPLTGIANRRVFLHQASQLTRRQLTRPRPVAVLRIDLDHFESINDRFGHATGDRALQLFARTTSANLRPGDLFGRLGGQEFGAVLYDVGSEQALTVAERIRFGFADEARLINGELVGATVSIGMVVSEDGALEIPPLLAQAEKGLSHAKARGRNRVEVIGLDLDAKHSAAITKLQTAA